MRLKKGNTSIDGMHPAMLPHMFRIDEWWRRNFGYELIITGGTEKKHSYRSEHYRGTVIDARTWTSADSGVQVSGEARKQLCAKLKKFLGKDWFVLNERTHFHIAWRPTK